MRHTPRLARTLVPVALLAMFAACKREPDPAIGQRAAAKASEHVTEGVAAIGRVTNGFTGVIDTAARSVGPTLAQPVDVARVRNTLRDLHDDRSTVGRDLSLYPTWFVAAVGPDGKGIAGDRTPDQDYLPGKDLATAFPCVRAALQGTAGSCVGEFSSGEGQRPRVYYVQVSPARAQADGPVAGAVVGAITFGRLAKSVRELLNLRTVRDRVQISVGLLRNGHVAPSGADNDVTQAFLVPDSLVPRVPADARERLTREHGRFTFTFRENDGQMQWGAAVGEVPPLGADTALVVFRADLRQ